MDKRTFFNMLANTVHFIAGLAVSFFFTPFLIRELGEQAFGFVGLSESFTSYLAVLTAAFNAMAGRFIAVSFHKKDEDGLKTYLSTVFYTNILLSLFCNVIFAALLFTLKYWIVLPTSMERDVQMLFFCVFLSFSLGLIFSVFTTAAFCKNRLDLRAAQSLAQSILRILLLWFFFTCLKPSLLYMGVTTLLLCLFDGLCSLFLFQKLLPGHFPKCRDFKTGAVRTLVSAGIWNTVVQMGNLLLTGLDLLLTNLFCSPAMMGLLAVSKSIPNHLLNFANMLSNMFTPSFTKQYAQDQKKRLLYELQFSCRMIGFILSVPTAGMLTYGDIFYMLWLPGEDARTLQLLTVLGMSGIFFTTSIVPLYNVFTVTNRLKYPSLALLCCGLVNMLLVLLLLHTTELGVLAIAGTSTAVNIIRETVFIPFFASKCLDVKKRSLYKNLLRPLLAAGITIAFCIFVRLLISPESWESLVLCGAISAAFSYTCGFIIVFSRPERRKVWRSVSQKLLRR